MPDYASMSDADYQAEMQRQAQAAQAAQPAQGGGPSLPITMNLPAQPAGTPMRQPTDPTAALAAAQINQANAPAPQAPTLPTPTAPTQDRAPEQTMLQQEAPMPANPYDSLMRMSGHNTASTMRGLNQAQQELQKAQELKAKATVQEAQLNAKTDADIARINQAYLNTAQEMQAQNAIKEQNRAQDVKIEMDKYERLKDDILNTKIDPEEGWKHGVLFGDNVIANKIVAAIGIGLAGFGGQGDSAVAMVNNMIDRSIQAQKANLDNKRQGADLQSNIVGLYRQQFQDGLQADLAAKMALQEHAIDLINQRKLNAKAPADIANANNMIAQMKADFAKTQQDFLKVSNAVVTQGISQQANLQGMKDENDYRMLSLDAKATGKAGADSKLFVPGAGYATDEDSAKKARESMQIQNSLDQNLKALQDLRAKHGGGFIMDRADIARGSVIKENIKRELQSLFQMGVLQEHESKDIDKIVPDPDTYSPTGAVDAAYTQLQKSTRDATLRKLGEYMNPALSYRTPRFTGVQEQVVVPPK